MIYGEGWELYLDDQNRINLRLINVLPTNLIHVRSMDSISRMIGIILPLQQMEAGKQKELDCSEMNK